MESLLRMKGEFKVIICDNASEDSSIDNIRRYMAEKKDVIDVRGGYSEWDGDNCAHVSYITLMQTGANLGYAGGNNFGISFVQRFDPAYQGVWILNVDTSVDADALCQINRANQRFGGKAILGSILLEYEAPNIVQMAGGALIKSVGVPRRKYKNKNYLDVNVDYVDVDYVSGASIFIPRLVLERNGLMDDRFFLYWEETDYCVRYRRDFGVGSKCVTASKVWHKEGAKVGARSDFQRHIDSLNMIRFYKKNYPVLMLLPFVLKPLVNLLSRLLSREYKGGFLKEYLWQSQAVFLPIENSSNYLLAKYRD